MSSGPGPLPPRWLHCPRKCDEIIVQKFVAFKTPLSAAFRPQMDLQNIFEPEMLFDYMKRLKLRMGLWIDLTNTDRFYDRRAIEAKGVQYIKLCCRGHGETPTIEQTRSFIEFVHNFTNEQPFDLIGVHCTHGFNRTGFLIISYLIERLDFSVDAALATFARARPPGIYKQDYIDELYRRYDPSGDVAIAPTVPDWSTDDDDVTECSTKANKPSSEERKRPHKEGANSLDENKKAHELDEDSDDDELSSSNGNAEQITGGGNSRQKKRRRELVIKNAQFMEGVPGVEWIETPAIVSKLQKLVQEMCCFNDAGFPGAQPVSMDRDNIQMLKTSPYLVSWKADGTRYMMLIKNRGEIYFFDRNNSCFKVHNLSFVKANNLRDHITNTLVDGEMVLDKYNGAVTPRYLIYDIITIQDYDIAKKPLGHRLRCIEKQLIAPRYEAIMKGIIDRSSEPFGVRIKNFWPIEKTAYLLSEHFTKHLTHEPDGLIYQPEDKPYLAGVCDDILKWKPLALNTIDFLLKIDYETGVGILKRKVCFLYVGGLQVPFQTMAYTKAMNEYDQKIIECSYGPRGWQFLRVRTDKSLPNSLKTARAVIKSIQNCVEKDFLLEFIASPEYHVANNVPVEATSSRQQAK